MRAMLDLWSIIDLNFVVVDVEDVVWEEKQDEARHVLEPMVNVPFLFSLLKYIFF